MKALILNSGAGRRMGALTADHPKCMTEVSARETILSRQLRQIAGAGITEAVITTGAFDQALMDYCKGLGLPLDITFVKNPDFESTSTPSIWRGSTWRESLFFSTATWFSRMRCFIRWYTAGRAVWPSAPSSRCRRRISKRSFRTGRLSGWVWSFSRTPPRPSPCTI